MRLSDNPIGMDSLRILRVLAARTTLLGLVSMIAAGPVLASENGNGTARLKSPDKHLVATVSPVRNATLHMATESTVSILNSGGSTLQTHHFSSQYGDQGYFVDGVKWTPDSEYCVFRMRSSGGHSPMFAPIVFWKRKANRFYSLKNYTADIVFSIAAPDTVKASTWPTMHSATVSLGTIKESEVLELK
jgi:hypothetical protein